MGVDYCHNCDRYIDLDYEVEHFPVQSDGCYDNSKCINYYEQHLTSIELEQFELYNEIEFIMHRYFKGYDLSPMEKRLLINYKNRRVTCY